MPLTLVPSPKAFPEAVLFRTAQGRYIRVARRTVEKQTDRYVLQLQAYEVDQDDNLLDTPEGGASRSAKSSHTIMRAQFANGTLVLKAGWAKSTPPPGQAWDRNALPENAELVDQLPATGEEGRLYFLVVDEQGQFWRYDAKGELLRLMEMVANEADTMWNSLVLEIEDGL